MKPFLSSMFKMSLLHNSEFFLSCMSIILPEKEKDDKAKKKIKEENEKEEVEGKDGQKVGKRARERIKEKMEENERCFRSV